MRKHIALAILTFLLLLWGGLITYGMSELFREKPFSKKPPNFIYAQGGDMYYGYPFELYFDENSRTRRIRGKEIKYKPNKLELGPVKFYFHDSVANVSREISIEKAGLFAIEQSGLTTKNNHEFGIIDTHQLMVASKIPLPLSGVYLFFKEGATPRKRYLREKNGPGLMYLNIAENKLDYFNFIGWVAELR